MASQTQTMHPDADYLPVLMIFQKTNATVMHSDVMHSIEITKTGAGEFGDQYEANLKQQRKGFLYPDPSQDSLKPFRICPSPPFHRPLLSRNPPPPSHLPFPSPFESARARSNRLGSIPPFSDAARPPPKRRLAARAIRRPARRPRPADSALRRRAAPECVRLGPSRLGAVRVAATAALHCRQCPP
jgi:hypothetical protein